MIPAAYRRAMGVRPGDEVLLSLEQGQMRVLPPQEALRRAQAAVRRYVKAGRRLSEELLVERRAEAKRD